MDQWMDSFARVQGWLYYVRRALDSGHCIIVTIPSLLSYYLQCRSFLCFLGFHPRCEICVEMLLFTRCIVLVMIQSGLFRFFFSIRCYVPICTRQKRSYDSPTWTYIYERNCLVTTLYAWMLIRSNFAEAIGIYVYERNSLVTRKFRFSCLNIYFWKTLLNGNNIMLECWIIPIFHRP